MLCSICVGFDVRELLLKAEAQPPQHFNDPTSVDFLESFRPAISHFFRHHPNLISLRTSAADCELCRCIWQSHSSATNPNELTGEALGKGTNTRQIFIGTSGWDATLNGLPHIAVIQDGDRGAIRTLASFEVCALRGKQPVQIPVMY